MGSIIAETFCDFHRSRPKKLTTFLQSTREVTLCPITITLTRNGCAQHSLHRLRRAGAVTARLSLLVLILVLAGVLFYPRVQALLTPVPAVQIQMESSVLPDTAPNCAANPRVAAALHAAMRDQTDATVYDCDAETLEACMAELLDDPELWVRSYRYTVHSGLNAHITVTFDWVYPDDGPARREELARTADGPARRRPGGGLPPRAVSLRLAAGARALRLA